MNRSRKLAAAMTLAAVVVGGGIAHAADAPDDPFAKLKSYDYQTRASVEAIQSQIRKAGEDKAQTAEIEKKLVGVLEDSSTTLAGKQEACRMLWEIGTGASVPVLTRMLDNEKESDFARYALERNQDPSAAKALRNALSREKGKVLIGVINSIGERADADAVSALKPFATSSEKEISESAITALGKIGTDKSVGVLKSLPATSMVVNKALVRSARHLTETGKKKDAQRLYDTLAKDDRPVVIRAEAVRGLAVLEAPDAGDVALAAAQAKDEYLQQVGTTILGTLPDAKSTSRSLTLYPSLSPSLQVVMLTALADRHEAQAAPLVLKAMDSSDASVRAAAIEAAVHLGGEKMVPKLLAVAVHGNGSAKGEARGALARLPGADAEQALLREARQGAPEVRTTVLAVLAARPTPAAMTVLLEAAQGTDGRLSSEALRGLGRVAGEKEYAGLVRLLVSTSNDGTRDAAKDAVVAVGKRLGDGNKAAEPLLASFESASSAAKAAMLPALAEIGGDRALQELTRAASSSDAELKQAAVSALADTWSAPSGMPALLNIAKSDGDKALRLQALRGYLRLVGQEDRAAGRQKVQQIAEAIAIAVRPEEKRQALGVLRNVRSPEAIELAGKQRDDPEVFGEAADAVLYLAAPQRQGNRDLRPVKGAAASAALDKLIAQTKDDAQKEKAQKLRASSN